MRALLIGLLSLAVGGCSKGPPQKDTNDVANEMVTFAKDNPNLSDAYWKDKGTLICRPKTKNICGPQGCTSGPAKVWLRITPSSGGYERCDSVGCDKYQGMVSHSGIWTTVAVPDRAMMVRLAGKGRYVETLAQWDDIYMYHGQCSKEPL